MNCPSIHVWSDAKCVREHGHDGYCRSEVVFTKDGEIKRTHWLSVNGVFKSHYWYEQRRMTPKEILKCPPEVREQLMAIGAKAATTTGLYSEK